jgi:hypothetical protein
VPFAEEAEEEACTVVKLDSIDTIANETCEFA